MKEAEEKRFRLRRRGIFSPTAKDEKYLLYLPAAVVFIFNLVFFNRYFPLTEGWWHTFGYFINSGLVPFRDFNAVVPPIFMYFNSLLLKILGDQFIYFRFLGILVRVTNVFLLQVFLADYFPRRVASLAALFAFFLSMSDPAYIAYDYHAFVDLLIVLGLLSMRRASSSGEKAKSFRVLYLIGAGAIVGLLTFLKQNIGLFLFLGLLLSILIRVWGRWRDCLKGMGIFGAGYFSISAILLYLFFIRTGAMNRLEGILAGNDAKGSLFTVMGRFAADSYNRKVLVLSLGLFLAYVFVKNFPSDFFRRYYTRIFVGNNHGELHSVARYLLGCFLFVSAMAIAGLWEPISGVFYRLINSASLSVIMYVLYKNWVEHPSPRERDWSPLMPPLIALAYCNTHTAGFNFVGMLFPIAFSSAFLIEKFQGKLKIEYGYLFLSVLLVIASLGISKLVLPYNWWGLSQGMIGKADQRLKYHEIEGFYVDRKTKVCFDRVKEVIEANSRVDNDVYLFPNIPIFYLLHRKIPPYGNAVQWFDFISKAQAQAELRELINKPPKVIVFLDPPQFVYDGHFRLLKRELVQLEFRNRMNQMLIRGDYEEIDALVYDDKFFENTYDADQGIVRDIVVTNQEWNEEEYGNLEHLLKMSDFRIKKIVRGALELGAERLITEKIRPGDVLTVEIKKKFLNEFLRKLGYIDEEKEFYVLRILVRRN